jgi:hypothetical protein
MKYIITVAVVIEAKSHDSAVLQALKNFKKDDVLGTVEILSVTQKENNIMQQLADAIVELRNNKNRETV